MRMRRIDLWIRRALAPAAAATLVLGTQSPALATTDATRAAAGMQVSTSAQTAPGGRAGEYRAIRASDLIAMDVVDARGRDIGAIVDAIVDLNTGELRYAMLSFDPGLFSAQKLFAVPLAQIQLPARAGHVVYEVDRERLEQAAIERSDGSSRLFTDEQRVARLDRHWNVQQPTDAAHAYRVSDLLGKDVKDRNGEDIGEVEDVVIDMASHKAHYALLEIDSDRSSARRHHAFALASLQPTADGDELMVNVDATALQDLKGVDADRALDLNDPAWVAQMNRSMVDRTPGSVGRTATGLAATASRFRALDTDRNGWLTRAEARADGEVDGVWSKLDSNEDGRLSRQEFAALHGARGGR